MTLSGADFKHSDPSRDVMRWVWRNVSGERITLPGTGFDDYGSQILPIRKLRVKGVQSVAAYCVTGCVIGVSLSELMVDGLTICGPLGIFGSVE
jgi:hypothetical protein